MVDIINIVRNSRFDVDTRVQPSLEKARNVADQDPTSVAVSIITPPPLSLLASSFSILENVGRGLQPSPRTRWPRLEPRPSSTLTIFRGKRKTRR